VKILISCLVVLLCVAIYADGRSQKARFDFLEVTVHPNGWPGHIVDHVIPLACGGKDDSSNMQWQTVEEAKAKDKWERNCEIWTRYCPMVK